MSPIREQFLSLVEVEAVLHKYEEKYGMSTIEFLTNRDRHAGMLDDDIFQWESFHTHRDELLRVGDEVRSEYLKSLKKSTEESHVNNNLALAA